MATKKAAKKVAKKKAPAKKAARKGLDGRMRDAGGEIRKKRGDTMVKTLRKEYGEGFAKGYRGDTKLATVLHKEGVESLHALLKKKH